MTDERFQAICGVRDNWCDWEQRSPSLQDAISGLEDHINGERVKGFGNHHGHTRSKVIEYVDDRSARLVGSQVYHGPDEGDCDIQEVEDKQGLRRTPSDQNTVDDLVERGDQIETSYGTGGKVYQVRESETYGLPVHTIVYVPLDAEPRNDGTFPGHQLKWINELVAQDERLLKLFKSNSDEVYVKGKASSYQKDLRNLVR